MGYRIKEKPKPKPSRTLQDTITPARVYVHNGATANLAIPCWYQEVHAPEPLMVHSRAWHDYIGWPSPTHPDHSCQIPSDTRCYDGHEHERHGWHHLIDLSQLTPIHLLSEYEGYSEAVVKFVEDMRIDPDGDESDDNMRIIARAEIDPIEDWVVRILFAAQDPDALMDQTRYHFSVFVNADETAPAGSGNGSSILTARRSDIVLSGELVVMPSAY